MKTVAAEHAVDRLEGSAPAIQALRAQIRRLAAFDAVGGPSVPTVLLQGETGTGKGLVARTIHDSGPRARGPFIPVNCAAIPDTMLEAEMFGHEPGAFTDASRARPGLFEAAAAGTLFLDEIDSLSLGLQSKLLTAIESKRVRRLGAIAERAVDVKLVVATQQELTTLVAAGRFRADLYHRLAVVTLVLPPLRARGDDVITLAHALLERFGTGYAARPKRLTPDAETWLRGQPWPGNVRELGHLMERVTLLHSAATVDAGVLEQLAAPATVPAAAGPPRSAPATTGVDEAQEIRDALARSGGNVVKAARLLGLTRDTIRYRMRRHGIARPELESGAATPHTTEAAAGKPVAADATTREDTGSGRAPQAPPQEPAPAWAWEQKMVSLVAVSASWPEIADGAWSHEPWTEHRRWTSLIREKLTGLGAVPLQQGPAHAVWAFGLPRAIDQVVERAVHGALAIRHVAASVGPRERAPELRMAVHHGPVLVDTTAEQPERTTLAVGDTLALCVRLLGKAAPGDIMASAEVGDRIGAWVRVEHESAGPGQAACRIQGLRPWRERGSSRRLTPFVGRERELTTLTALMTAAEEGAGQLVGIVGPPGAGKSRLLRELRRRLDGRGVFFNEAHALADGVVTPLLPFVEMARSHFDVTESDSPETVWAHVREGLTDIGLDPEADGPYLVALLGGEPPAGVDAETLKRRILDLIRRITVAFCDTRPLLLTIENAHWLDPTSEACVAGIADYLGPARCLFVMTYRPGYRPGWLDRSYATQISLTPLTADESRRMIAGIAGGRAVPEPLVAQLSTWAEGNPLFLEELTRSVLDGSTVDAAIPRSVHAVIAARIDRLAPEDKRLLQIAAVVGREVPHDVLARVAEEGDDALRDRLVRLQAAELLLDSGSRAVRTYGFKHALTRAAAYQGVPAAARAALHGRVLEALVALGAESRPEALPTLAEHASAAGDWDRALPYFRRAGLHLLGRDANREAARCLEQAIAAFTRLHPDEKPDSLRLGFDVRMEAVRAVYRVGDLPRTAALVQEASHLAERLDDPGRLTLALSTMCHVHANEGRLGDSMEAGERALALAHAHGITGTGIWTAIMLGRTCLGLGRFADGIGHLRRAIAEIGEDGDERYAFGGLMPPSSSARAYLALCLSRTGEMAEAVREAEEAVRVAEAFRGSMDRMWAYYVLGRVHHSRTDWDRAIPLLERAAALCESDGLLPYQPRLLSGLAAAYAQSGRTDDAVPMLERAVAAGRAIHFAYGETLILCQLGMTCVAMGRAEEATRHATEALSLARARGERAEEASALLLLGYAAARRGPAAVDEARGWYEQGIRLGEELGMRPLVARARLALGALERRAGRREEADRHLALAGREGAAMGIAAVEKLAAELAR